MEPRRDAGNVRFRIDACCIRSTRSRPVMAAMTSRIKISRMDVVESGAAGRPLKTVTPTARSGTALSTMPTAFGEKLVMRISIPTSS